MIAPPIFASFEEFVSRRADLNLWWPYVAEVLKRHDLEGTTQETVAGFNPTNPTFLCGDVVVKLFGCSGRWQKSHEAERAAQALISTDPQIAAPRLIAHGQLFEDSDASWPYLVTKRMRGVDLRNAELSDDQRISVAKELGQQVRRIHALSPTEVVTDEYWSAPSVKEAAMRSSLPSHLVAQVDDYVARLGSFDRVFTHCDIVSMHVFVENGRLTGIIDWGDAMATDRHMEIIQLFRDTFGCDKALLKSFLDASQWPVGKDFAQKAMGFALHRQAVGLAQHNSIDVFEPIAAKFPLDDISTLDELANELFAV